ncbi:MAG: hypothetical protein ACXWP5_06615, partial [Bdellovibrionota bacterium]
MIAFQNSVYALARTSPTPNCATCHAASQAPLFAAADPNTAYLAALTQVNFSNIPTSLLAFYAGNSHCGNTSQCGSFTPQMTTAIQQWAAVEAPGPSPTPSPSVTPTVTPSPTPTFTATSNYWDGVTMRDAVETLRRASFQLLGRPPTAAEIAQVNPSDLSTLDPVLLNMMKDPTFKDRIYEIFNDVFLTDANIGESASRITIPHELAGAFAYTEDYGAKEQAANVALTREPIEMISYVTMNDRDFREIVNGQYRLLNSGSAAFFKISTASVPADGAYHMYAGPELKQGEYAGMLTTHSYIIRYPNTFTNRQRKRARYVLKNFLGLDVMLLSQPNLDTSQLSGTPAPWKTNPQCTVCHQVLDPVAGLFQNWSKGQIPGISDGEDYYFTGANYYGNNPWWYPYVYNKEAAAGSVSDPSYDMFMPGFEGQNLGSDATSRNTALAYLGQQIAASRRFFPNVQLTELPGTST